MRLIDADKLKLTLGCEDSGNDNAVYGYDEKQLEQIIDREPTVCNYDMEMKTYERNII